MIKTWRGDVVLVLFPNSDLRTAKRRPALGDFPEMKTVDAALKHTLELA